LLGVERAPSVAFPPPPGLAPPLTNALWRELLEMPSLPGVRRELAAVRAAAGPGITIDVPDPRELAFLPPDGPRPEVVHFCGHGFANEDPDAGHPIPLRAGLVMGDAADGLRALAAGSPRPPSADGLLFASEAAALRLESTNLVVLSACQTGLGHWQPGEHLAGLRHAFIVAGARHVASALWDLNDARAPELIRAFYGHLARGDPPPAALWRAQREWLDPAGGEPAGLRAALAGAWVVESSGW
jgi:CHAT domain-containing protein